MTRTPDPAVIIRSSDGVHWDIVLRNVTRQDAIEALRKALLHTTADHAGITAGRIRRTTPNK